LKSNNNNQNQADEACWYLKSVEEVLTEVKSIRNGLDNNEATSRLKLYGPNKIAEEEKTKL